MIKVAVFGAKGRMGATVCQAVEDADDLELVARLDHEDDINAASLQGAQIAVDFTVPGAALGNVQAALAAGIKVVVGTTGWSKPDLELVQSLCQQTPKSAVLIAPNFAISAVLAMHFAHMAARYFDSAEIIELHHPDKVDAPSGTALNTARALAQARQDMPPMPDATKLDSHGARGANIEGVRVHAVRLRGLVAHEEILFGNAGEQLTIRTDCFDRVSFMPGVLLAIRSLCAREGYYFGLDSVMEI